MQLDWHRKPPQSFFEGHDLVIGSDLVYYARDVAPLMSTLSRFLDAGSEVVIFLPLPPESIREALPEFLQAVADRDDWIVLKEEVRS